MPQAIGYWHDQEIQGDLKIVKGEHVKLTGNYNKFTGMYSTVTGGDNIVLGHYNTVRGAGNTIIGAQNTADTGNTVIECTGTFEELEQRYKAHEREQLQSAVNHLSGARLVTGRTLRDTGTRVSPATVHQLAAQAIQEDVPVHQAPFSAWNRAHYLELPFVPVTLVQQEGRARRTRQRLDVRPEFITLRGRPEVTSPSPSYTRTAADLLMFQFVTRLMTQGGEVEEQEEERREPRIPCPAADREDTMHTEESTKPSCQICFKNEVKAVCVPCGHSSLCMTCARKVSSEETPKCPFCSQVLTMTMEVFY